MTAVLDSPAPRTLKQFDQVPNYESILVLQHFDGAPPAESVVVLVDHREAMILYDDQRVEPGQLVATRAEVQRNGLTCTKAFPSAPALVTRLREHGGEAMASGNDLSQSAVVEGFHQLLEQAVEQGATDIHLRKAGNTGTIEFRVFKRIMRVHTHPAGYIETLCRAIYNVLAQDQSKETSFDPQSIQEAQLEITISGQPTILRFASSPAYPSGVDASLRLLPISRTMEYRGLESLGYTKAQAEAVQLAAQRPQGSIFICGTTNSGKSTTLQHLLRWFHEKTRGTKRILTIEDPVEYLIPGAVQIPVPSAGRAGDPFAAAMKVALRKDPDVIMVSEVRDALTAQLARRAVESGHPVFTTIHAGSPLEIVSRLQSMDLAWHVLGGVNFLSALVYQVLIPTVCDACALSIEAAQAAQAITPEQITRLQPHVGQALVGVRVESPGGCDQCGQQGVNGLTVCAEVITPTPPMRAAIAAGDLWQAQQLWEGSGDQAGDLPARETLLSHAVSKLKAGRVSPQAVEDALGDLRLYGAGTANTLTTPEAHSRAG